MRCCRRDGVSTRPDISVEHGDGWISLQGTEGAVLHVRARRQDDRLVITDIYLHAEDEITPAAVRGLSISRLAAELNAAIHMPSGSEATLLSRAADFSLAGRDDAPEPTLAQLRARVPATGAPRPERPRLTRLEGMSPDDFYPLVARAYFEYVPATRAPAKEMAAEAGVPITTVHRWIREARRRGFLPSAMKGKVG